IEKALYSSSPTHFRSISGCRECTAKIPKGECSRSTTLLQNPTPLIGGSFSHFLKHRCFTKEVMGFFLNKSEVTDRVVTVVKNFQKVDPSKVTPNAHFQNDLGLDSLDSVEIVMALEGEFGYEIPDNEADKINSINLAMDFIASQPQKKQRNIKQLPLCFSLHYDLQHEGLVSRHQNFLCHPFCQLGLVEISVLLRD
ncbi:hypothetical protein ACH5RR_039506, partial [Cinchona calisaya]